MIRLGLCCIFRNEPIRFRQTTAAHLQKSGREEQLRVLSALIRENLASLLAALGWVDGHGTGAFRILSPLFPRYTHPLVGYTVDDLDQAEEVYELCRMIRSFAETKDIRLSLHPDQFNVLSSPRPEVVSNTLAELEYQGVLAELLGIEVINIHAGGVYTGKEDALRRLRRNVGRLSGAVRSRLTLENDDRSYLPGDLLPVCRDLAIPFVYDIHHHRCLGDDMAEEEASERCLETWQRLGREPYFHLSSPKDGWQAKRTCPHADFIDPGDFPACWQGLDCTVDVEAKAKELAVLELQQQLKDMG